MTSSEIKRILSNVISDYFDQIGFDKLSDDKKKILRDLADSIQILSEIEASREMQKLWLNYQKKFSYANDISWENVMQSIRELFDLTNS